jgi:hypothetical protein
MDHCKKKFKLPCVGQMVFCKIMFDEILINLKKITETIQNYIMDFILSYCLLSQRLDWDAKK